MILKCTQNLIKMNVRGKDIISSCKLQITVRERHAAIMVLFFAVTASRLIWQDYIHYSLDETVEKNNSWLIKAKQAESKHQI